MQDRPFADLKEMNRVLIYNYNAVVGKDDIVYILGDIAHHLPVEDANEMIRKLKGRKILIKGNHDKNYATALYLRSLCFKAGFT